MPSSALALKKFTVPVPGTARLDPFAPPPRDWAGSAGDVVCGWVKLSESRIKRMAQITRAEMDGCSLTRACLDAGRVRKTNCNRFRTGLDFVVLAGASCGYKPRLRWARLLSIADCSYGLQPVTAPTKTTWLSRMDWPGYSSRSSWLRISSVNPRS
jgi:hypothetical protein